MSEILTNKPFEIKALTILECLGELLINESVLTLEELEQSKKQLKELEHYSHFSSHLWATDRPDVIPSELKDKYFFENKFWNYKKEKQNV